MNDTTAIILATALGPIAAVLITLWHQDRKQKLDAKHRLFVSLMVHRKSYPPAFDWVNSLNLIVVVFEDCPKVLKAWHDFYDYVHIKPMDQKQYDHKSLELLSEIAKELGYDDLKQTDIDKFYAPLAHGEQTQIAMELQNELLRVLKSTERISVESRK